jgi:hypothetical protein
LLHQIGQEVEIGETDGIPVAATLKEQVAKK